jgi:hypothetical protein
VGGEPGRLVEKEEDAPAERIDRPHGSSSRFGRTCERSSSIRAPRS